MKTHIFKLYLIFAFLQINTFLNAQQSFQILFSVSNRSETVGGVIEDASGNFLAVGIQTKIEYPTQQGMLWRISSTGDTLSKVFSFGDSTSTFADILQKENGNYVVFGFIRGATDLIDNLLILELNSDLQIVNKKVTVLPEMQKSYVFLMKKHLQFYYILLGNYGPDSNPPFLHDPYFVKLNNNFDTVMTRRYSIPGNQYATDMIFSPDGSQIWLFARSYFYEFTGASLEQMVIYDTLFNFISVKTFQDYFVDLNTKAKWWTDSTFLLGFQHSDYNSHERDLAFTVIDSTLIITDVSTIGATDTIDYLASITGFDFVNQDSIHFAGTKNIVAAFWPQEPSWLWVGLLNRNLNPLYQRFYGGDAYYHAANMIRTRDGGVFVAATRYNYLVHNDFNDAFFLKVNNEGLVTNLSMPPLCPMQSVVIYPNPGTDHVNLLLSESSALCQIFDLSGRIVFDKMLVNGLNRINCFHFKPGAYLINIETNRGINQQYKWIKR